MEIGCLEKCLARLFPFCRHLEEREVTLVGLTRPTSVMSLPKEWLCHKSRHDDMGIGCLEFFLVRMFPFCRHLEEREVTLLGLSRTTSVMSPKVDMTIRKLDV
jgi:hypothetical protein